MFSAIGHSQLGICARAQRIPRGPIGRTGRLLIVALLASLALCLVAGSVAAYAATPTVTGVSPDNGAAAGGTAVTITGTGFAVGASATHFAFGFETEATAVSCTTTTECTATSPEISEEECNCGIVDVTATVGGMESPATLADQFEFHGLFLADSSGRLPLGDSGPSWNGSASGRETNECNAFVGADVISNGEPVDEVEIGAERFTACIQEDFFGDLPFSFVLRLGADGSATAEGPMGVHAFFGCVYEGDGLGGGIELESGELNVSLGATLPLVAEEEPESECSTTETVSVDFGNPYGEPWPEVIGAAHPGVTGLSPAGGPKAGGTSVTITGAGLGEASAVSFGSEKATSFAVDSPTSITAVSPAGEGTVAVTVTTPRGTSPSGGIGDKFTYGPAVTGIEPDHGPRIGETTVTITGVDLAEASAVTFGSTPASSFTVVSPTSVTAVSPPGTGTVDVRVTTPEGTSPLGAQDRFSYDVSPPTAEIKSPVTGGEYQQGEVIHTTFSCKDGEGAPGIETCSDQNGATAGEGTLDTSTPGAHSYTVTAKSKDGKQATATISYTVIYVPPPTAEIKSPVTGGEYHQGEVIHTTFSCHDAEGAPGIETCSDQNGATAGEGTLDTSTPGAHSYTVTAKSKDGKQATATISYSVIPSPKRCSGGSATVKLSPGLTNAAATQTIKIKGTLTGCVGGSFTEVKYKATLKSAAPMSCSTLSGAGGSASGAAKLTWVPKTKPSTSTGTLTLLLTETPAGALSGSVASGPNASLSFSGAASEAFTGGPACGVPDGKKPAKAVKTGTVSGGVSFE